MCKTLNIFVGDIEALSQNTHNELTRSLKIIKIITPALNNSRYNQKCALLGGRGGGKSNTEYAKRQIH